MGIDWIKGTNRRYSTYLAYCLSPFNLVPFSLALHVKLLSHYYWALPCLPQPVPAKNFNSCKCMCSIGVITHWDDFSVSLPCLPSSRFGLSYIPKPSSSVLDLHSYLWRMTNDKWPHNNLQKTFPRVLCNTYLRAGNIRSHRSVKRWWFLNHWELELIDKEI